MYTPLRSDSSLASYIEPLARLARASILVHEMLERLPKSTRSVRQVLVLALSVLKHSELRLRQHLCCASCGVAMAGNSKNPIRSIETLRIIKGLYGFFWAKAKNAMGKGRLLMSKKAVQLLGTIATMSPRRCYV